MAWWSDKRDNDDKTETDDRENGDGRKENTTESKNYIPAAMLTVILLRGYKAAPPCPLSSSPLFL
jgi:hypothetical protein